ncbi:putative pectinesterase/pectinesterase inhibitor 32 [Dichanthelium oligosanthes]|uniref:Putative pectinesterase/pectinesterase inhibitor 32 n=1 Tax=Dichanthelium oligosanthes TaxID=888268 RepID=A0A1E5V8P8_9POAL|nr:putative pectinesterase/pectinesterase inhibitor 32 [Dichanthelium oligosanthes]
MPRKTSNSTVSARFLEPLISYLVTQLPCSRTAQSSRVCPYSVKRTPSPLKDGMMAAIRRDSFSSSAEWPPTMSLFTPITRLRHTSAGLGISTPESYLGSPSSPSSCTLMEGCDGTLHPWTGCTMRSSKTMALVAGAKV